LFEPVNIDGVTIRNRIALSPMVTNFATPDGYPTDEYIAYIARRARHVGLIITEYTYIDRIDSRGSPNQLGIYSDELIPKLNRLVSVVHGNGARIFIQLVHAGRKTRRNIIWGNTPIAPSKIPLFEDIREMTEEDIERVINEFAEAARRAERAGFDGIEIHGAHGYLVAQFLSPATNKRRDKYGNGVVFLSELLKAVRVAVSIPVGLRISATEFDPSGLTPQRVHEIVKEVEPLLSYVHISAGRDGPLGSSMPFYYKRPAFIEEARIVREGLRIPMFLVGSVVTLDDAEKVLDTADVVVIGRQLLADPDWPIKVKLGLPIRPCIRCNQSCRGFMTREVRCDVNPELGWEILPPLPRVTGQVRVIGGGVMGLEVARVLASVGLEVELYEKEDRLGGQLNWLLDPWKRMEFLQLLNYYIDELKRLNVKIRLNTEVKDCDTDCIWAVPEETQPRFIEYRGLKILIDSNLYAYQDYAFEWVRHNEVYITERSLRELDLARRYLLIRAYEGVGVKVISDKEAGSIKADITMREFRRDQPNLGKSISRGYWLARNYILTKITQ